MLWELANTLGKRVGAGGIWPYADRQGLALGWVDELLSLESSGETRDVGRG